METGVVCARLLVFVISLVSALGLGEAAAPAAEFVYPPVNESDGRRVPLYFSLIQSFSGQYVSANSITGLELALDQVNEDPRLLPGYSLHYVFTDAPVSSVCMQCGARASVCSTMFVAFCSVCVYKAHEHRLAC